MLVHTYIHKRAFTYCRQRQSSLIQYMVKTAGKHIPSGQVPALGENGKAKGRNKDLIGSKTAAPQTQVTTGNTAAKGCFVAKLMSR